MIEIDTYQEYHYATKRGYSPLLDWRMFKIEIGLRIRLQKELFGAQNRQLENQKYYEYIWENSLHICHETCKPLHEYSAVYISHIISRGENRFMALDPRNSNVLCFEAHQNWENPTKRKSMNIFPMNKIIIQLLKNDYR